MAEDFMEEINGRAEILLEIKKMIRYCHNFQILKFTETWERMSERLTAFCREVCEIDPDKGQTLWNIFLQVTRDAAYRNLGKAADGLENSIPHLYDAMKLFGKIDVEEGDYRLFSSGSGYLCIKNTKSGETLCSENDPAWEARERAEGMYIPGMKKLYVLGSDLGYFEWQFYDLTNESIDIWLFDTNSVLTDYALQFGVLGRIPEENLHIVIEKNQEKLLNAYLKGLDEYKKGLAVYEVCPDVLGRLSGRAYDSAYNMLVTIQTSRNLFALSEQNYYRNTNAVGKYITDLRESGRRADWVVVGGGPSVDSCIDYLRSVVGKKKIIAAATIYKRLLAEEIKPDYIAVIDPQNRTFDYLRNVTSCDVPLIMADLANWQFSEKYRGEKYLVPMEGYYFSKERYRNLGMKLWEMQGTVSGFGIDVAAFLGAERIELVGVDLAYPTESSHASGVDNSRTVDRKNMIEVEDVNGKRVFTSRVFGEYIRDIEEQIANYSGIRFFNLSDCGAKIKGCKRRPDELK